MKVIQTNTIGDYIFRCLGCEQVHIINTQRQLSNGAQWSFNGNNQVPTFAPSFKSFISPDSYEDPKDYIPFCCHFFIRSGRIEFCSDCTHSKKGTTMELPELKEEFIKMAYAYTQIK